MSRIHHLIVEQIVHAPKELLPGILYVSKRFETVLHICPCGCGDKVVTPLHVIKGWRITGTTDDVVTLRPSILNPLPFCGSHYYITENGIDWL